MECPEFDKLKGYANYLMVGLSVALVALYIILFIKDKHLRRAPGKLVIMFQIHLLLLYVGYLSSWPEFEEYEIASTYKDNRYHLCMFSGILFAYNMTVKWAIISCIEIEVLLKIMRPSSKDYSINPYIYYAIANLLGVIAIGMYLQLGKWAWNPISGCMLGDTDISQ